MAATDEDDLTSLEMIDPVGAAVPVACEEIWRRKCRNFKAIELSSELALVCEIVFHSQGIINMYGQSECGCVCGSLENSHLGTVFPDTEVKVRSYCE